MRKIKNIFVKKFFLIYGFGKSGLSSYSFLKKNNKVDIFDDKNIFFNNNKVSESLVDFKDLDKKNYDFIVISPGIDINKCLLKNFIKKNLNKLITDLDIFYINYKKNLNITITGTNGKSTTVKLLFDILREQKKDVRMVGNIGNPILSEKKIKPKTIFVIEASSYQIEYSKYFCANYAAILNITPDHLERHGTFQKYIKAKFKLIKNQTNKDFSFLDIGNKHINKEIIINRIKSNIINVSNKTTNQNYKKIKNSYFLTEGNKENLSFVLAIIKRFRIKNKTLFKTINNFKGLKYRQEIIFKSKKCTLINDSKSTSYSSSMNILKSLKKTYWILGGLPKKNDKFLMNKKECKNFRAYIFGKNKKYFIKELKEKIKINHFKSLKEAIQKVIYDVNAQKNKEHKTILFSPSAASFDEFKNFEDRGQKFNILIKKLKLRKIFNAR